MFEFALSSSRGRDCRLETSRPQDCRGRVSPGPGGVYPPGSERAGLPSVEASRPQDCRGRLSPGPGGVYPPGRVGTAEQSEGPGGAFIPPGGSSRRPSLRLGCADSTSLPHRPTGSGLTGCPPRWATLAALAASVVGLLVLLAARQGFLPLHDRNGRD